MPMEVDYEKIGQRVRKLRLEKGLTQAQLAEAIGCSNNYLGPCICFFKAVNGRNKTE